MLSPNNLKNVPKQLQWHLQKEGGKRTSICIHWTTYRISICSTWSFVFGTYKRGYGLCWRHCWRYWIVRCGHACLAQPPTVLNGEIIYACAYARSGDKPSWSSTDVEVWSSHHQGRSTDGFGATASRVDTSLIYFEDAFDPDHSDHNRVDRLMVLVQRLRV